MIRLGSNILSEGMQRSLARSNKDVSRASERLSSGQRINRASDDAAGLAIAMDLNARSRVFAQGVRNLNDGLSYLNVADAATGELTEVLTRLKELAAQAANGVYSQRQRQSLHKESQSLQQEYNRILETTEFNGLRLFNDEVKSVRIQAGYGEKGGIDLSFGSGGGSGVVGDGTFGAQTTYGVGTEPQSVTVGDFNGDGIPDIASANASSNNISVLLGNGDGTFAAHTTYGAGTLPFSVTIGDFNGDGIPDIATANFNSNNISILLGNGDGTFGAHTTYGVGTGPVSVTIGDFNGNGIPDIATANFNSNNISILLGNGDGTFAAQTTYGAGTWPFSVTVGDFNGDGIPDLATANQSSNNISILLGNGDGTFAAQTTYGVGTSPRSVTVGDFNGDGIPDVASANQFSNNISILLGNGDGTFAAQTTYGAGTGPRSVTVGDFNGDGISDLATANTTSGNISVLLGNGDGTFGAHTTYGVGSIPLSVTIGDFNGDGIPDIATANQNSNNISILLGNATTGGSGPSETQVSKLKPLEGITLVTRDNALASQSIIDGYMEDVSSVRSVIGANMGRISVIRSLLLVSSDNLRQAESGIVDTDIAVEAEAQVRAGIRQDVGASLLGQANQTPQIALTLLQNA